MRFGTWVFNDLKTNEKLIEYDFTNDSLLFLANECYPDSFLVKVENEFIYTKVDWPLVFIGYINEEEHIIGNKIYIPGTILSSEEIGTSILPFKVDETGNGAN